VRVALGATSSGVSGMIVREGLTMTTAGLVLGLGMAVLSSGGSSHS
jgi:ABC-type antimicrobial peptide transport system permease subunit